MHKILIRDHNQVLIPRLILLFQRNYSMDYQSESRSHFYLFRDRSRSRSRSKYSQESQENSSHSSVNARQIVIQQLTTQSMCKSDPEQVGIQLSKAFFIFFQQIKHRKGFIMLPKDRTALQKEQLKNERKQLPKIDWTNMAQWDLSVQSAKIEKAFSNKSLPLSSMQIQGLKRIFLQVSTMFGKEPTSELYQMLFEVIWMCIRSQRDSKQAVENFFVGLKNSNAHYFFNFKFSTITKHKLRHDYDEAYRKLGSSMHRHLSFFLQSTRS